MDHFLQFIHLPGESPAGTATETLTDSWKNKIDLGKLLVNCGKVVEDLTFDIFWFV